MAQVNGKDVVILVKTVPDSEAEMQMMERWAEISQRLKVTDCGVMLAPVFHLKNELGYECNVYWLDFDSSERLTRAYDWLRGWSEAMFSSLPDRNMSPAEKQRMAPADIVMAERKAEGAQV